MTTLKNDQDLLLVVNTSVPNVRVDQDLLLLVTKRLVPATISTRVDQELLMVVGRRNPRTAIFGGQFQGADGSPLAGGYLIIKLSCDAMSPEGQVVAGIKVTVPLDETGNVSSAVSLWSTELMNADEPVFYAVTAYTANGQRAWGAWRETLPNVPTYDIGNWVPGTPA